MRSFFGCLTAASALLLANVAAAQEASIERSGDDSGGSSGATGLAPDAQLARRFPREIALSAGVRLMYVADEGFVAYASNGWVPALALSGSVPLLRIGDASIAVTAGWNIGGRNGSIRGEAASVLLNRLTAGLEGRYALAERLYLFARAAPGAVHVLASVEDPALPGRPLEGGGWTWGVDTTGGAGLLLAGSRRSRTHLFLVAEAGYAFAGAVPMRLTPGVEEDDPRNFGTVTTPDLRPAGAVASVSLSLSF